MMPSDESVIPDHGSVVGTEEESAGHSRVGGQFALGRVPCELSTTAVALQPRSNCVISSDQIRCGMGAYRTADPAVWSSPAAANGASLSAEVITRRDVHSEDRLPVASRSPRSLPPRGTVHDYLGLWNWDGTLDRIHHALYLKCREKAAREALSPRPASSTVRVCKALKKGGSTSTGLRCRQA